MTAEGAPPWRPPQSDLDNCIEKSTGKQQTIFAGPPRCFQDLSWSSGVDQHVQITLSNVLKPLCQQGKSVSVFDLLSVFDLH